MSEAHSRRIRAQGSARDPEVMGFVLDAPLQAGASVRFEAPDSDAPLARALFALDSVRRVEVSGATIWLRKSAEADWGVLKPAVAETIRHVLDESEAPLGRAAGPGPDDPDARLLAEVEELLDRQINPAIAAHGGRILAERVIDGAVHLRMTGGCQGCAASAATLREGVERMLRAALPQLGDIVDVTDHEAGSNPFYTGAAGAAPGFARPVPEGVIGWEDGQLMVAPDYLAPRLGLTLESLREGLRTGEVTGVTETGVGDDAGRTRVVLRSPTRAWAAEILADGTALEVPPPRAGEDARKQETSLADRVRAHLESLPPGSAPVTYGKLARALGHWLPGSVHRVTRALETTMREDAAAGRPFIAARAVSRAGTGMPGQGFFDLARALGRGPQAGEAESDFHARELATLDNWLSDRADPVVARSG